MNFKNIDATSFDKFFFFPLNNFFYTYDLRNFLSKFIHLKSIYINMCIIEKCEKLTHSISKITHIKQIKDV